VAGFFKSWRLGCGMDGARKTGGTLQALAGGFCHIDGHLEVFWSCRVVQGYRGKWDYIILANPLMRRFPAFCHSFVKFLVRQKGYCSIGTAASQFPWFYAAVLP